MSRGFFALLFLALPTLAQAEAFHLVNGQWYDGETFVEREFFGVDGVLRTNHDGPAHTVDLDGAWVVPGLGNAHTHSIGNQDFAVESQRFLRNGVFYVANPNSVASRTQHARAALDGPDTVDALFANGGLTSSGGHPIQIFEKEPGRSEMEGDAYWIVDDLADLEAKWAAIVETRPDFLKVYLEQSESHAARKDDPSFYGKRGLDPRLVAPIVERTHADGMRVAAHVTSRADFVVAIKAGVDEIAHLPLESLTLEDAELAANAGVVVVTTVLSHRPAPHVADLDRLHRANLHLLQNAGVAVVLGTDSQASVVDEVIKLESLGLDRATLLRMLVVDTPRHLFPHRSLALTDGAEASFVALEGNPLEALNALERIDVRYKQGRRIEVASSEALPGIGQELVHTLMAQGPDAATAKYQRLRSEQSDAWDFSEGQLDALGRAMIQHGKVREAVAIFQLNCEQFPRSSKAWESLGDAHAETGAQAEAVESYNKAMELDPNNEGLRQKRANLIRD
jgi:tetratricopeptide (TPR) repeat protein